MKHIKGHLSGPHKALIERLQAQPNVLVIFVDEYLTSKICFRCNTRSLDAIRCRVANWQPPHVFGRVNKPWAVRRCYNAGCTLELVNRDLNAAVNIMRIFLYMVFHANARPAAFRRH